ncbi:MAG: hypothetical protein HC817_12440 [Saprospiraceae bacterium]|nr:hypothetical protein [Saprospiraceae bacterium]
MAAKNKKVILVEDNLADVELVKISVRELDDVVELVHVGDGQELLNFLKTAPLKRYCCHSSRPKYAPCERH